MKFLIGQGIPLNQGRDLTGGAADVHDSFSRLNHIYGYAKQNPGIFTDPFGLAAMGGKCAAKLKVCRIECRKRPLMAGVCFVKCEEKYGALSDCNDDAHNHCEM
jgi:hypothetical protein